MHTHKSRYHSNELFPCLRSVKTLLQNAEYHTSNLSKAYTECAGPTVLALIYMLNTFDFQPENKRNDRSNIPKRAVNVLWKNEVVGCWLLVVACSRAVQHVI